MQYPSFEDLAKVIRDSAQLKKDKRIDPDSQVCRDLGISGDVEFNILKAIESHYQIVQCGAFRPNRPSSLYSPRRSRRASCN